MTNKKYFLFMLLAMIIGINNIYADDKCYYMADDGATLIEYNETKEKFNIKQRGDKEIGFFQGENLINKGKDFNDKKETGLIIPAMGEKCPKYIVYRRKSRIGINSDGIFGFDSLSEANNFSNLSNQIENMDTFVAGHQLINGDEINQDLFYSNLGKKHFDNNESFQQSGLPGNDVNVDCNELFGDKNDPNSIRYLVDKILEYPKIIVPVLIILYGCLDFAKAVIIGKEDEMKKAQKTFAKRLIMGVAFFFIPLIVDLIMHLADIVWEGLGYTTC